MWWRDSGAAEKLPEKKSYSVDAWGRRRGGSTQGRKWKIENEDGHLPFAVKLVLFLSLDRFLYIYSFPCMNGTCGWLRNPLLAPPKKPGLKPLFVGIYRESDHSRASYVVQFLSIHSMVICWLKEYSIVPLLVSCWFFKSSICA